MEEVQDQHDQTEPEACHGNGVEERRSGDRVEVRDLDADETDQVEDDDGHLHETLLRPPVWGIVADLGLDDRLPGRRCGRGVLAGETDFGGVSCHLKEEI